MSNYSFPNRLHSIYIKALGLYQSGHRNIAEYFDANDLSFLTSNGISTQSIYDYVEDDTNYSEPGWNGALAIELVRRNYFLEAQRGIPSPNILDVATMPAKTDTVHGVEWLPRLIPKAKAKLRGELPTTLMFNCGGDRRFFKHYDILPSEFLSLVWRHEHDDQAIINWVVSRTQK